MYNETGQPVLAYPVYRCWLSEYVASPELEANGGGEVMIESLVLQKEGRERDYEVTEPTEPCSSEP